MRSWGAGTAGEALTRMISVHPQDSCEMVDKGVPCFAEDLNSVSSIHVNQLTDAYNPSSRDDTLPHLTSEEDLHDLEFMCTHT